MDYLWCEIDTDLDAADVERALLRVPDVRTHCDALIHPFLHLSVNACDDEDRARSEAGLGSGPCVEVWTHPRAPWSVPELHTALIAVWRALMALPVRGLAVMSNEGRLLLLRDGEVALEDRGPFWTPDQTQEAIMGKAPPGVASDTPSWRPVDRRSV